MKRNRNPMPEGKDCLQIAKFWDAHSVADYWGETKPAHFDVEIKREETYYPLGRDLSRRLATIARAKRLTPRTLLNRWIKEKVLEEA